MKKFLLFLLVSGCCFSSFSQSITQEQFQKVIPLLKNDQFKEAFNETKHLLDSSANDSSLLRAIVRYMHIVSAAGMVSTDEMKAADFATYAESFVGQPLLMPAHPCIDSAAQGFNSLQFVTNDGRLEGMTITTNKKATSILCFEYFRYADEGDPSALIGKTVRSGGFLNKVEVNGRDSKLWIARLYLRDAFSVVLKQ